MLPFDVMILILSDKNDMHADHVQGVVQKRGLPFYRLNLDVESLKETTVTYQNGSWMRIEQRGNTLNLDEVQCVWGRRTFVELLLDEQFDQTADFKIWKNEWNKTLLGIYMTLKDRAWLNPWRISYQAENKYLQMKYAAEVGLVVPRTLVSNDRSELIRFAEAYSPVVLKLMHQDFYKGSGNDYQGIYVNIVTAEELAGFGSVGENPVVLQQYTEKSFEVRYTVVGDDHFVCRIDSQRSSVARTDWRRYDIPNTPHYIMQPPKDIRTKVSELMSLLQIEYGALGFIVTPDGDWFFLEVNSMGQFLWIEDLTGLSISDGIVNWMEAKLSMKQILN